MPLNLTGALASRKPSRRVRFAPAARVGVSASSSPPLPLRPQVSADTLARAIRIRIGGEGLGCWFLDAAGNLPPPGRADHIWQLAWSLPDAPPCETPHFAARRRVGSVVPLGALVALRAAAASSDLHRRLSNKPLNLTGALAS